MKTASSALCVATAFFIGFAIPSCEESKGPGEKIGEKIDDALDERPAEGIRDAVEEVTQ